MTEEERFVIDMGDGFAVIAGRKLNDAPLTRAAADRLAHEPAAAKDRKSNVAPEQHLKGGKVQSPPLSREAEMLRRALADDEAMTAANARPISPEAFAVERAHQHGGSSGFSCNGILLSGKKPR